MDTMGMVILIPIVIAIEQRDCMIPVKIALFIQKYRNKLLSILVLLVVCACSGSSQWRGDSAIGSPGPANSARLFLPPANDLTGLELEFVQMKDGLRLYVNVFGLEIPEEPDNPGHSRMFVSFREYSYHFSATRFQGGQRLLIPEYVQSEIIDFLQEGQPVYLQVERYESVIYPDKFLGLFHRMVNTCL